MANKLPKRYNDVIKEVAESYDVDPNEVYKVYSSYFKTISNFLSSNEDIREITIRKFGVLRLIGKCFSKIKETSMLEDWEKERYINQIKRDYGEDFR